MSTEENMGLKVIITGVTGMVGEGVLTAALKDESIKSILSVSRKSVGFTHPKLKELIVPDFLELKETQQDLQGFDACFYCVGISSNGLDEKTYTKITYDTSVHFAEVVGKLNPKLTFNYMSGAGANSSEKGRMMWTRVKGRTENKLKDMFPGRQYSFRPGLMKPFPNQTHLYGYNKYINILYPVFNLIMTGVSLQNLGDAMIYTAVNGYSKTILEAADINKAAKAYKGEK
ncbi:uncharacterized protein RJT21DRAFT_36566 [Scheffersomyces amazonensis]|uniref:uncharacterized protein n=1 Tax=Scheffersomyces amazonensis TaxID=1078765 RepID=UPI00315D1E6C